MTLPGRRPLVIPHALQNMPQAGKPFGRWRRWAWSLLLAFAFTTLGTLLLILPWLPNWGQNYFSGSSRKWYEVWMNPYFRGAISGVGVINLLVSFSELYALFRGDHH